MVGDILQPTHLLFVLVIALLVLGPKRLPEAGRSLGRGLRDFKDALSGDDHDRRDELAPAATVAAPPPQAQQAMAPSAQPVQVPEPVSAAPESATTPPPADHAGA